jgi:hypothetical protein
MAPTSRSTLERFSISRRENHLGALGTRSSGSFKTNARAAADHDNGLVT